jgi:hypothetical protein
MKKSICLLLTFAFLTGHLHSQPAKFPFRIRTVTAGVTLTKLSDTAALVQAIHFLKEAQQAFTKQGYEVQTLRIATFGKKYAFDQF